MESTTPTVTSLTDLERNQQTRSMGQICRHVTYKPALPARLVHARVARDCFSRVDQSSLGSPNLKSTYFLLFPGADPHLRALAL